MLCRPRHQQAKDPLRHYRYRSVHRNEHLKDTPSFHAPLAVARLLVDWLASLGFFRVFIHWNNPENADIQGVPSGRSHARGAQFS